MNGVSVVDVLSVLALFLCLCAKKRTFLIASHGKLGNLYVMVVAKSLPINHLSVSRLFTSKVGVSLLIPSPRFHLIKRGGFVRFSSNSRAKKTLKNFLYSTALQSLTFKCFFWL